MNKDKLALFDLDGTLFDTRWVNYLSYKKSLKEYGFTLDQEYFFSSCNGKHYKTFLPNILGKQCGEYDLLENIHERKKEYYSHFLKAAIPNAHLFYFIHCIRSVYHIVLVTTASRKNTFEILSYFGKKDLFELIITGDDVQKKKPNPEGFHKAMTYFSCLPQDTVVFEDSLPGFQAAEQAGIQLFKVEGFH